MARGRQSMQGEIRAFVIAPAGMADRWRRPIEAELRARGALAARLGDAAVVIVLVTRALERPAGWEASMVSRIALKSVVGRALAAGTPVVPILVEGARMPPSRNLPRAIQQFSFQQALRLDAEADVPAVVARAIAAGRPGVRRRAPQGGPERLLAKSAFISYRRDDSGYWAKQLARELVLQLGSDNVFLDVGSARPGTDFRPEIENRLRESSDVVAVMGAGFLERDGRGVRRLDDPGDYVRQELRLALSLGKKLHAVLVGQAQMPRREDLPADIAGLAAVQAVFRLSSDEEAAAVAEGIARGRTGPLLGRDLHLGTGNPVIDMYSRRRRYERRAASIVDALAEHGWQLTEKRGKHVPQRLLVNARFPGYRMRLEAAAAEVILEEQVGGGLLGGGRWVQRAVFPISPHQPEDLDLFRLSDRLLDAALDPPRYLERTGRVDLSRGQPPPMRPDRLFEVLRQSTGTNASAVELYQRTWRRAAAEGGVQGLIRERTIRLPDNAKPWAVAGWPNGAGVVAATSDGVVLYQGGVWRASYLKRRGSYRCADIARNGRIAAGSDDSKISVWDSRGTVLVDAATPYSLWRQLKGDEWIKYLSWSADGETVACADGESVWLYSVASRRFARWQLPVQGKLKGEYGVKFTGRGRELVAFAHSDYAWVVDAASGRIRGKIELEPRPMKSLSRTMQQRFPDEGKWPEGSAFHNIYTVDVSPDGRLLACGGADGQIMLYDLDALRPVRLIAGHDPMGKGLWTMVEAVAFSPDGRWLASVANDNRLLVWNTATWEPAHEATISWPPVRAGRRVMTWLADSSRIAGCAAVGELEIWHLGGL